MDGFGLSMRHAQWLVAEVERLSKWKDAIIDACVVSWVLKKEHENNPKLAVNDLCVWCHSVALDPKVSSEAKALHGRIAILEEENARLKALGESGNPTQAYA